MVNLSLYYHIPFCKKKCHYCHFYVIPDDERHKQKYIMALKKEWEQWSPLIQQHNVASIYFGGGTPALIGPSALSEILGWFRSVHPIDLRSIEVTLEANPENITYPLMRDYALAGVNRVSIGIQTLDDQLLAKLGRTHSAKKAEEAVYETHNAGIENITVDLMYDLPLQNLQTWESTLNRVVELPIKHVSLYNMTVEPHTVFFKQKEQILKEIPDEACSLQMYEMAVNILEQRDFRQYEISAFCREGWHSRHNCGYWTGREFIGLGPSAFSYLRGKRFSNVANLNRYCTKLEANETCIDFEEQLAPQAALRELLAIRLRLVVGVDLVDFQNCYGRLDEQTLEALKKLHRDELVTFCEEKVQLTKKGILFYDSVAVEII